ncbi:MAG: peptidoglycan editing factor PgeF [Gammaproteobacteria bacterium]|nr:peptidoglycan editing factor PgeF [Gammaproteobacteria bacterium]
MPEFLVANWPAPANVRAGVTTRQGGVSVAPYDGFNLATHVGDNPAAVAQNRALLRTTLKLPAEPVWLEQVHGVAVVNAATTKIFCADASYASEKNIVCTVMTADCLPVLICNRAGTKVAAAHAGWRGLHAGVIEASISVLQETPDNILIWLGPAIGPQAFEVGDEVRTAFVNDLPQTAAAFKATSPGHWLADIYQLARLRLARIGVNNVYGGDLCTYTDQQRFYSYRRDGKTGRMASLIWIV